MRRRPCPVCRSDSPIPAAFVGMAKTSGCDLSHETGSCQKCSMAYAFMAPSEEDLSTHYKSLSKYSGPSGGMTVSGLDLARFEWLSAIVSDLSPKGLLLDVGCGSGGLLRRLSSPPIPGLSLAGTDPSEHLGLVDAGSATLSTGFGVSSWKGGRPSAIVMAATLEHMEDPVAELRLAREALLDGGFLVVEVPDISFPGSSGPFEPFGEFSGEHLQFFTGDTLSMALAVAGFETRRLFKSPWPDGSASVCAVATPSARPVFTARPTEDAIVAYSRKSLALFSGSVELAADFLSDGKPWTLRCAGALAAKTVHALSLLGIPEPSIVIDSNPNLAGTFLGQAPVMPPGTTPVGKAVLASFRADRAIFDEWQKSHPQTPMLRPFSRQFLFGENA